MRVHGDFQISRPICRLADQSAIGRLDVRFANWSDWQIGRNIDTHSYLTHVHWFTLIFQSTLKLSDVRVMKRLLCRIKAIFS